MRRDDSGMNQEDRNNDSWENGGKTPKHAAKTNSESTLDRPAQEAHVGYVRHASHAAPGGSVKKGKHRAGKIVVIVIASLLAGIVAACLIYAALLDKALAAGQTNAQETQAVLTKATTGQPYYILILGSDSREGSGTSTVDAESGTQQRSDVMILARIDQENKKITLVSIPRDTRWEHDGTVNKINEAYNLGGAALSIQVVEQLTGVSISHCVEVNFSGLEDLVDTIGGIEVTVPQDISYKDALTGETVSIKAGKQTLDGQQTQIFARVRKAYTDQDPTRQSNIREIITAVINKIKKQPLYAMPNIALKAATCLGTDMRTLDILPLATSFLGSDATIYSGSGPSRGANDPNVGDAYLLYPNPEGWQRVMDVVNAGGDPSAVDPNLETVNSSYTLNDSSTSGDSTSE